MGRLRRAPAHVVGGFWDCALLGRRKWRLFPPDTPTASLCVDGAANESSVDTFTCGPDVHMVQTRFVGFAPGLCWECEQAMGDAVVVPNGWWYQTYDDDRTLSISAKYGVTLAGITEHVGVPPASVMKGARVETPYEEEEPEVIEFEL